MKKAFTMIELIFVIVILGILAAVAIPRLAATRDDAEMSKAANNLSVFITDLSAYYTSNGNFASDINQMTNVMLSDENGENLKGKDNAVNKNYLQVKKALCFMIELGVSEDGNFKAIDESDVQNDFLKQADSIRITAIEKGKGSKICKELFNLPAIKSVMTSSNIDVKEGSQKVYTVGGTNVVYETIDINEKG